MSQVAPGIARFELHYTIPDNIIYNVFHVKKDLLTTWTQAELDAAEAEFVAWFTGTGSLYMNDSLALFEILATDLTSLSGIRKLYPVSPPLDGNMNAELLPANVTFAFKASIATRGRGTSGRVFWPTISATQVSNEQMLAAVADTIATALNTLRTGIAGLAGVDGLCVPHFVVGGSRPPEVQGSTITNFGYSDLWLDSQRLRLPAHKKAKKKKTPTP